MISTVGSNSDMDSSGRDPLDDDWEGAFRTRHARLPTDVDRQDRLFSLIILGGGPEGAWTDEDWAFYLEKRESLWEGDIGWWAEKLAPNYDRFETHLERLASYYGNDRDAATRFTRAVGLVWSGIAYEAPAFQALARTAIGDHELQLHEGPAGWKAKYVDDANPAHHWAGAFFAGFMYGTIVGAASNSIRDIAQYVTGQGGTWSDILLGNVAASQGSKLWRATRGRPVQDGVGGESEPYATLIDEMRQELAIAGAKG
ncbi:MAG TPA: hypothetical protein VLE70_08675 [Anaerolineae bacterium]|nr:hypothetical protein [Anaerolineae bacterium]